MNGHACQNHCCLMVDENEEHSRTCLIAIIPWLSTPSKLVPMLETKFYSKYVENGNCCIFNIRMKVFRTFCKVFPFYLPGRYHRPDAVSLNQHSEKKGDYWVNVGHFITVMSDRGTIPYYNLVQGEEYYNEPRGCLTLEMCKTAVEFLLEPWVIVQLPFQPALLHQWAVAALAETLRYCKRLAEIGSRGYAPQFQDLYTDLARLSQVLTKNCNTFIYHFFAIYCENLEENIHTKALKMYPEYPVLLTETLGALEFILSDDCSNCINYIKNTSWSGESSSTDLMFSTDGTEIGSLNINLEPHTSVYSDLFWTKDQTFKQLYVKNVTEKRSRTEINLTEAEKFVAKHFARSTRNPRECLRAVKNCVKTNLLNENGPLADLENKDEFISKLENYLDDEEMTALKQAFLVYWSSSAVSSKAPGFDLGGIIQQMLNLQADVFAEFALGTMTRLTWRAAKKFDGDFGLLAENGPMDKSTVEVHGEKLRIALAAQTKWTLESILQGTDTAKPKKVVVSLAERDVEIIAAALSFQIRLLVLNMHKKHYDTLREEPFRFQPETHIAQYVVPCFIATVVDVIKDSNVDDDTKMSFILFLNILISGFAYECVQLLGAHRKQHAYLGDDMQSMANLQHLSRFFVFYFKNSKTLETIFNKMHHLSENTVRVIGPKNHPRMELFTPSNMEILVNWLCLRVDQSLAIACIAHEPIMAPSMLWALSIVKGGPSDVDKLIDLKISAEKKSSRYKSVLQRCLKEVDREVMKHSAALTSFQLFSISIFEALSANFDAEKFYAKYQESTNKFDYYHLVLNQIVRKDLTSLRKSMLHFMVDDNNANLSLIPLEVARKNLCCRPLLKALTASKKLKADVCRIVFPIKHCGQCGLVYAPNLSLCRECKDEPKYPHPLHFCSDECELMSLEKGHTEEHATFVMMALGL